MYTCEALTLDNLAYLYTFYNGQHRPELLAVLGLIIMDQKHENVW